MLHSNKWLALPAIALVGLPSVFLHAADGSFGRISKASSTISLRIPEYAQLQGLSSAWQRADQDVTTPFCLHSGSNYTLSTDKPEISVRYRYDKTTVNQSGLRCATDDQGVLELDAGGTTLHGVVTVIVAAD